MGAGIHICEPSVRPDLDCDLVLEKLTESRGTRIDSRLLPVSSSVQILHHPIIRPKSR